MNRVYQFGPYRVDVALSRVERARRADPTPAEGVRSAGLPRPPPRAGRRQGRTDGGALAKHVCRGGQSHPARVHAAQGARRPAERRPVHRDRVAPRLSPCRRRAGDCIRWRCGPCRGAGTFTTARPAAPAGPATVAAVLEGERKQASVLRCTLSNAADVVERLGPAGLPALMARLLHIAADEIARYEGVVSSVIPMASSHCSARPGCTKTTPGARSSPRSPSRIVRTSSSLVTASQLTGDRNGFWRLRRGAHSSADWRRHGPAGDQPSGR